MRYLVAIVASLLLPVAAGAVPVLDITDGSMRVGTTPSGIGFYIGGGPYDFGGEGFRIQGAGQYQFRGGPDLGVAPIADVSAGFYTFSGTRFLPPQDLGPAIGRITLDPAGEGPRISFQVGVPIPEGGEGATSGLFTTSATLYRAIPDPNPENRAVVLTGGGTVEATLIHPVIGFEPGDHFPGTPIRDPSRVVLGSAEFHFSPVPEPATLLLVGSAAISGALVGWRRRR
jgi:hypothetical protein